MAALFNTVDDYIRQFPGSVQDRLRAIRVSILSLAPAAEERFSYGMPAYTLDGKPLLYFAGYKHHTGIYATPAAQEAFSRELSGYKQGKGSVQFPHENPLPMELIKAMIAYKVKEIGQQQRKVDGKQ